MVWKNDNFAVPDTFSEQRSFIMCPFMLPIQTAALMAVRLFDQTKVMIRHSDYEGFARRFAHWSVSLFATVHHDQHHQRFTYNFANKF